jgi:hypothetical protein
MTTTPRHFTAWMANDPSVLDQPFMDVTVLEDEATSYRTETREVPEWSSTGKQAFYGVTTVDAREGDAQDGIKQAEELLGAAGWRIAGKWEATDSAYLVTVERGED